MIIKIVRVTVWGHPTDEVQQGPVYADIQSHEEIVQNGGDRANGVVFWYFDYNGPYTYGDFYLLARAMQRHPVVPGTYFNGVEGRTVDDILK